MPLSNTAGDVVVIDAAAIAASTADSLEDLLRREAGLQLSRNGGPGQNAAFLVRGTSAASVVVLVDGVRMGSASLGQVAIEGLSMAQIDHIEVLRGAASSLWGADAVGGVVRITTKRGGEASSFAARVSVGGLGSSEAALSASGRLGAMDVAASLSRDASKGVSAVLPGDAFGLHNPDRDGYVRRAGHLKLGYAPAVGHHIGFSYLNSRLNAQYDGAEFAPPTFASNSAPDFRNLQNTRVGSVDYRGAITDGWTQSLQWARQDDDLRSGGTLIDRFKTQRDQLTWQHRFQPHAHQQWVLALERVQESVGSTAFTQSARRNNSGLVLGLTSSHGPLTWQADGRHDRNSVFGSVNTGRAGVRWALDEAWSMRSNLGTAFRAPSFNDLYFPGFGVASVKPERSRSAELGVDWRRATSHAGATLYRTKVRDLIAFEPNATLCPADPAYSFGCARNVGRARMQGASFKAAQQMGAWRLSGTMDLLDAKDSATGTRLPRRAAHQGSLQVQWSQNLWSLGAAVLRVGSRPDGGALLQAYTTLDLQAKWRLDAAWLLEAKVTNASNVMIQPARDYQAPGRQAWLGLRYEGKAW